MKRTRFALILIVWLTGCQVLPQVQPLARLQENREATPTPFLPLSGTVSGAIWFDPHLPPALLEAARLPAGWQITDQSQIAQVQVEVGGNGLQAGCWVYAVVARFATVQDEINSLSLRRAWYGLDTSLPPLIVEADTLAMFTGWWGVPGEGAVQVVPTGKMSEILWQQPEARGIIPFERLEARLKVLAVDGISPLARGLDESAYPLALPYVLSGERAAELAGILPRGNRDESKMTVVAVTGVTALVRAPRFTCACTGWNTPSAK